MKKIVLILLLMGFVSQIEAQKLSAGYKMGINQWLKLNKTGPLVQRDTDGLEFNTNYELFFRLKSKKRLVWQWGVAYNCRKANMVLEQVYYGSYSPYNTFLYYPKVRMFLLNMSVQYKIELPEFLKDKKVYNRVSNYIGIDLTPGFTVTTAKVIGMSANPEIPNNTRIEQDVFPLMGYGINHTMMYKVANKINIITTLSIKHLGMAFQYTKSNAFVNFSAGATYDLN